MWEVMLAVPARWARDVERVALWVDEPAGGPAPGVAVFALDRELGCTDARGVLVTELSIGVRELVLVRAGDTARIELGEGFGGEGSSSPARSVQWLIVPDRAQLQPGEWLRYRLIGRAHGRPVEARGAVELQLAGGRVVAAEPFATDRFGAASGALPIPTGAGDQRASLSVIVDGEVRALRAFEVRRARRPALRAAIDFPLLLDRRRGFPRSASTVAVRWATGEPLATGELRVAFRGGAERIALRCPVVSGRARLDVDDTAWRNLLDAAMARQQPLHGELEIHDPLGRGSVDHQRWPLADPRGSIELLEAAVAPGGTWTGRVLAQLGDGRAAGDLEATVARVAATAGGARSAEARGRCGGDGSWFFEVQAPRDGGEHSLGLALGGLDMARVACSVVEPEAFVVASAIVAPQELARLRVDSREAGAVRVGYAIADPDAAIVAAGVVELVRGTGAIEWRAAEPGLYVCRAWSLTAAASGPRWRVATARILVSPRAAPRLTLTGIVAVARPGDHLRLGCALELDGDRCEEWGLAGWMVSGGLATSRPLEQRFGHPPLDDVAHGPRLRWRDRWYDAGSSLSTQAGSLRKAPAPEHAPDSPWWLPQIAVGRDGVSLDVRLPARAGRQQLRLVGTLPDGRCVEERRLLLVERALGLEADLPETLVVGDQVEVVVWLRNAGDASVACTLAARAEYPLQLPGASTQDLVLAPGERAGSRWRVVALGPGEGELGWRLAAAGAGAVLAPDGHVPVEEHLAHRLVVRPRHSTLVERTRLRADRPVTIASARGARAAMSIPGLLDRAPLAFALGEPGPRGIEALACQVETAACLLQGGRLADQDPASPAALGLARRVASGVAELLGQRGELGWGDLGPGSDATRSAHAISALLAARRVGCHVPEAAVRKAIIALFRSRRDWSSEGDGGLAVSVALLEALYAAAAADGQRRVEEAADELERELVDRLLEDAPPSPFAYASAVLPLRQHDELVRLAGMLVGQALEVDVDDASRETGPVARASLAELCAAFTLGVRCGSAWPAGLVRSMAAACAGARPRDWRALARLGCDHPAALTSAMPPMPDAVALSCAGRQRVRVVVTGASRDELAIALARIELGGLAAGAVLLEAEPPGAAVEATVELVQDTDGVAAPLPRRDMLEDRAQLGQALWVSLALPAVEGGLVVREPIPANAQIDLLSLDALVERGAVARWQHDGSDLVFELERTTSAITYVVVAARPGRCTWSGPSVVVVRTGAELHGAPGWLEIEAP